jgi:hypothetical protein
MITDSQREILRQFFAGYFHQDWPLEADTPDQVISNYARQRSDRSALIELRDAIIAFIADHPDDDDLADALFRELGCYYSPEALGESTKQWLLHVADELVAGNAT